MADTKLPDEWAEVLQDIDEDSPYTYTIIGDEVELYVSGSDEAPGGVVGMLHQPSDWRRIKQDANRFGIWPSRISF